jgi:hypothetical protein
VFYLYDFFLFLVFHFGFASARISFWPHDELNLAEKQTMSRTGEKSQLGGENAI